jgi:signal transduction histidine kinase
VELLLGVAGAEIRHLQERERYAVQRSEAEVAGERERIAAALQRVLLTRLHDTEIGLQAALVRDDVPKGIAAQVEAALVQLGLVSRDVQAAVRDLRPGDDSATTRIWAVIEEFASTLTFRPAPRVTGPVSLLDRELADALLDALREALTNVLRHSAAGGVRVQVDASAAWLTLTVDDDGIGFRGGLDSGGRSLGRLRNAVTGRGGLLHLGPVPPHGTRFLWMAPLGETPLA